MEGSDNYNYRGDGESQDYESEYSSYDDHVSFGVRWNIIIPDVRNFINKRTGDSYSAFKIIVNDDKVEWYLWKRYREFYDLHIKLAKKKIFKFTGIPSSKD